jgi:hypothetical protein
MVAAHQSPPPVAIVRAWSQALNTNDNEAAAELFAPGARVVQPGVDARLTPNSPSPSTRRCRAAERSSA